METLLLSRFSAARKLRKTLGLPSDHTNVFRLVNSEGDRQVHTVVCWKFTFWIRYIQWVVGIHGDFSVQPVFCK